MYENFSNLETSARKSPGKNQEKSHIISQLAQFQSDALKNIPGWAAS